MRWPLPALVIAPLTAIAATLVGGPPAAADHTDLPGTVTLVGSLQNELGCAEDWQPACTDTRLERVGASSRFDGVFTVPAGAYAYKVAIGGSWDENYGADGAPGGADIPLVLAAEVELRVSYDHATHAVRVAPASLPSDQVTAADRELAGRSLRADLTRERFYFLMTDRFANAVPGNDLGGYPDAARAGFDPEHPGYYHGGDLRGLIGKLDYIQDLGTTAIWLTPTFKNRPVQDNDGFPSAGYHGYWITDFTQIDPHLGTNDDLKELIDAAHDRGMKVFFDIITNHTADVIDYREQEYDYITKQDAPYRDAAGKPFDDREFAAGGDFPELDAEESFPYTPYFPTEADAAVKAPAWLNDLTLYHNRGNSTFAGESSEYGDFFGLDDLFTEHPEVVEGMGEIYQAWVDFGVDGFRIDTAKHVNVEFWQQFIPGIRAAAARNGNPDFFAFGEVFDADPRATSRYTTTATLQSTLDFPFQAAARAFATGDATVGLRDVFANDDWYIDTDSNAYSLPTFLGNHDMGRIGNFVTTGQPEAGGADGQQAGASALRRVRLAHELMYLTRGQPVVYYGDEQGFVGDGGDQAARQDMFGSKVASYNDDDLLGTDKTTADDNFDPGHPLYQAISTLADLRKAHPALADGAQVHRYASNRAGVYAFSRIDRATGAEYLVALNNATTEQQASFDTYQHGGEFRPLYGSAAGQQAGKPGGRGVKVDREGRVTVTVPALSAAVWRAVPRPAPAPAASSTVTWLAPAAPGGTLAPLPAASPGAGRAELRVAASADALTEVTFGWRLAGTSSWNKLGTDDNAPYRVLPDVSALPRGAVVELRAVARDAHGRFSASSTAAVIGDPAGDQGGGIGPLPPVVQPDAVSVPGDHNDEMGCPAEWAPDCPAAQLTRDTEDDIWKGSYDLPAGSYAYKAAINGSWDENYGQAGTRDGGNIGYSLTDPGSGQRRVSFYYDHRTHLVTSDAEGPIITAAGSFQSELGCGEDSSPDCMRAWLQDPDGDGVYIAYTDAIPAGRYEVKVAHGLSWDESYGAGGEPAGDSIPFQVTRDGSLTVFRYDLDSHLLTVINEQGEPLPDLDEQRAHWVRPDLLAWPAADGAVPPPATVRWRLHWSVDGGLAVDAESITGGESAALRWDPRGLPADVLATHPELAGHLALRLDRPAGPTAPQVARAVAAERGLAVAMHDDLGRLRDASGVRVGWRFDPPDRDR